MRAAPSLIEPRPLAAGLSISRDIFRAQVEFGWRLVIRAQHGVMTGKEATQPAVARVLMETLVPELRDLEGRNLQRRREDAHRRHCSTRRGEAAGQRGDD